jgi:two-component sensor histidine kinase
MEPADKSSEAQTLRTIKHDIKNQLSNVNLVLAQLKYDMKDAPADQLEYLEMMAESIIKIDAILNSAG